MDRLKNNFKATGSLKRVSIITAIILGGSVVIGFMLTLVFFS